MPAVSVTVEELEAMNRRELLDWAARELNFHLDVQATKEEMLGRLIRLAL